MNTTESLAQRVFVITGASSGIGAATAQAAAQAGYRVVLAGRSLARLQATADLLGDATRALVVPCDTTSWADLQSLVATTLATFGRIDVLFANSGIIAGAASFGADEATPEAWQAMIQTNVAGTAFTIRAVLPALLVTRGHVILTGSVLGHVAMAGSVYAATKWAITGMAEALRKEVRATGVRVTLVSPGRVATPFGGSRDPDPAAEIMLTAADVAGAVLYAVSQPPHVDVSELVVRPIGAAL